MRTVAISGSVPLGGQALDHLKVVDLSQYVSGAFCTRLLAGFGAEVIKVEMPGTGDPCRALGPFPNDEPHPEKGGLFLYLNAGKKGITLNLKTALGVKILKRLLSEADVLVENFEPRVMPGLGLDYSLLEKVNPKLVMVSISNFGQTGPYRDYKATDIVEQALGGLMYQTGDPEREPLMVPGSFSQFQAGLHAFLAALSAVYEAEETGKGQHIDISTMEVINAIDFLGLVSWLYQKQITKRRGHIGAFYPSGVFPCQDGFISVVAVGRLWSRLAEWIGAPELTQEKFSTPLGRMNNRDELDAIMLPWLAERTKEELYHGGQSRGIPITMVRTVEDLTKSPQLEARGFWVKTDHPVAGRLTYPGAPGILSATPWRAGRAPLLGEHNGEIYCGRLGFTRADLVRMRQSGII